jgi:hypothetical protein
MRRPWLVAFVIGPLVSSGITIALISAEVYWGFAIAIGVLTAAAISLVNAYARGIRGGELIGWMLLSVAAAIPITLGIGFAALIVVLWHCQCLD